MKTTILKFSDIAKHPTNVLSAEYWVSIKQGKLPFSRNDDGEYVCSHTKNLTTAIYLTEQQAKDLNIAIVELKKAQQLVELLKLGK